jgi:hypothetical protein
MLSRVSAHVRRVLGAGSLSLVCVEQAGKAPLNSETLSIGVGGVALTALLINRCPAAPSLLHSRVLAPLPLSRTQPAKALARWPPRCPSLPRRLFTDDLANAQGRTDILVLRLAECVVTLGPTHLLSTFPPRSALPEPQTCGLGFRV